MAFNSSFCVLYPHISDTAVTPMAGVSRRAKCGWKLTAALFLEVITSSGVKVHQQGTEGRLSAVENAWFPVMPRQCC